MEENFNVPNYMIKQMIATELYERRDNLIKDAKIEQKNIQTQEIMSNHVQEMMENASQIGDLADQIRMGQIPLDQCLSKLTLDEKQSIYQKCKAWKEKHEELEIEQQEEK